MLRVIWLDGVTCLAASDSSGLSFHILYDSVQLPIAVTSYERHEVSQPLKGVVRQNTCTCLTPLSCLCLCRVRTQQNRTLLALCQRNPLSHSASCVGSNSKSSYVNVIICFCVSAVLERRANGHVALHTSTPASSASSSRGVIPKARIKTIKMTLVIVLGNLF